MTFADREDAQVWILRNQLARRNLTDAQRIMVAEKLRPFIAEKAKEQQISTLKRGDKHPVQQKSAERAIDTRQEIADLAGVSHDSVGKSKRGL